MNIFNKMKISCIVCRGSTLFQNKICHFCLERFIYNINSCLRCAIPMTSGKMFCGHCLTDKAPVFDRTYSAFSYEFPINKLIGRIKNQHQLIFVDPLVSVLIPKLKKSYQEQWPDVIVPVPLYKKKFYQRGFNQAFVIAKSIYAQLHNKNIQLQPSIVIRHKDTDTQTILNIKQRQNNVKNVFGYVSKKEYRHVAVVDDVVTTGATVAELTKVLKKNGVKRVDVWCLAKTPI